MKDQQELIQKVKDLIRSNRTEKALELLAKEQLSSLDKELIIISGRFNKVKEDQILGVIDDNEARKELNKINLAILGLSEKIIKKPGKSTMIPAAHEAGIMNNKVRNYLLIFLGVIIVGSLIFWMARDPQSIEEQPDPIKKEQEKQDSLAQIKRDQVERDSLAQIEIDKEEQRKFENSNRQIKVTLVRLVCEMSDDEGAGNDADMDRFNFILKASQTGCNEQKDKEITGNGLVIYNYSGGEITTPAGYVWMDTNKSVNITFDNEHCKNLNLSIEGYARESDNTADEEARNAYSVPGNNIFGDHSFKLSSSDFVYRCEFKIEKVGNW